ncbi:Na(+)/H(+) antiporter NhaA [Pedobacter antarcticus 4BY]|uniref:Na(+)/H(+) antiporter NhaA n=2 Tax=Pedobacter antarcticus TaxID=34086 RepID=A0A081PC50_9SPHI|nr:Na+/H+ antiporter NhaA [Pedobacter antarcticus]KEQ28273.1 Na(+)/H(+) antiporter NhaA [Pedobacter antarcticus 4BY]SFE47353.1 sodium/proton antiporter, NhaA family [Pedobacter antarcticus]
MKKTTIEKIMAPVSHFIHLEHTSGIVLLISVVIAIAWANSPFHDFYEHLWHINFTVGFDKFLLSHPLHIWINDGLMAIFFFVIGLELKREFMEGELSSLQKASLPMTAALGGMLVPAAIYFLINKGTDASHGWGIPMATDIAFALALLSMASKHIPISVKIFLSALAVADDLGAVLVIAFFYTEQINFMSLGIGAGFLILLMVGNRMGIRSAIFYLVLGICVWIGFLLSGVHATIAGVLVAFTIPAVTRIDEQIYSSNLRKLSYDFEIDIPERGSLITPLQNKTIQKVKSLSMAAETPLQTIEHALHPWVAFGIMPLFALANAGIVITTDFFSSVINPVSIGVAAGLIIGKFIGILFFCWIMVRFRISSLPEGANWKHIAGVALLAGIGFTMSLFISGLAFKNPVFIDQAKYGILIASIVAGILGTIVLKRIGKSNENDQLSETNNS